MAGLAKDHDWEESMQMASINMDSRLSIIENLMTDNYGRIAVNQDDLMRQLMNKSVAAGTSFDYAAMEKVKEMMDEQYRDASTGTSVRIDAPVLGCDVSDTVSRTPPGGLRFPRTSGAVGSSGTLGRTISYPDTFKIEHIIKIRDKLDDFLDGSNVLIKVMNPQTIREMVREMRNEIRTIKKKENISELDIVNYLEEELTNETNRRADARARIDKYDADNEVPF